MTAAAFKNALIADMAMGCSTNTVLHLPAIAHEAGVPLDLDMINEISYKYIRAHEKDSKQVRRILV